MAHDDKLTDIRHFSKSFQGNFIPVQHQDDFFVVFTWLLALRSTSAPPEGRS